MTHSLMVGSQRNPRTCVSRGLFAIVCAAWRFLKRGQVLIIAPFLFVAASSGYEREFTIAAGPFEPSYDSLQRYECPDWFRDAKLGIWAHWGPQCAPEQGDWYARKMYEQYDKNLSPGKIYEAHIDRYGHPSEFGFKDVINTWKAERWDPEGLMALYKQAGARYFVAMANHHDNFDNYDSTFQPWNSVNLGPKKDIIAGWAKAARAHGLRFGVSNHSSHAWHWYQKAYGYDVDGPRKGVRYDGWSTREEGKGKWWEGYDPQELYGGNHYAPPPGIATKEAMFEWFNRFDRWYTTIPERDNGYALKWFRRCQELIDRYQPDLLYFDDHGFPLERYGLGIAAHFYNANQTWHGGRLEAVINAKKTDLPRRKAFVLDIERGKAGAIDPLPWQTDDCIGVWHYRKDQKYKTVGSVVKNLVDIVSKNGNLLLSIPVRSDGTIDDHEQRFLADLGRWMAINGDAIYGTRPWRIYGEGKTTENATETFADGEVHAKESLQLDAGDLRFTSRANHLFAFVMGLPQGDVTIESLGRSSIHHRPIKAVKLIGSDEQLLWQEENQFLRISKPHAFPSEHTVVFDIEFQ